MQDDNVKQFFEDHKQNILSGDFANVIFYADYTQVQRVYDMMYKAFGDRVYTNVSLHRILNGTYYDLRLGGSKSIQLRNMDVGVRAFSASDVESVIVDSCELHPSAFNSCLRLKSIIITNVTKIPTRLCYFDSQLQSVEIGEGCDIIQRGAFRECTNLSTVKLPSTISLISPLAFEGVNNKCHFTCNQYTYEVLHAEYGFDKSNFTII